VGDLASQVADLTNIQATVDDVTAQLAEKDLQCQHYVELLEVTTAKKDDLVAKLAEKCCQVANLQSSNTRIGDLMKVQGDDLKAQIAEKGRQMAVLEADYARVDDLTNQLVDKTISSHNYRTQVLLWHHHRHHHQL